MAESVEACDVHALPFDSAGADLIKPPLRRRVEWFNAIAEELRGRVSRRPGALSERRRIPIPCLVIEELVFIEYLDRTIQVAHDVEIEVDLGDPLAHPIRGVPMFT